MNTSGEAVRGLVKNQVERGNMVACVASVPIRSKRHSGHAREFFAFGQRKKWGASKKVEGRGWGRGKKGTLARKPLDFK